MSPLSRVVRLLLAVLSGVLVFTAFPNWNLHFLAWFGLVPLLVAARGTTPGQGFRLGLVAGTVTNVGGFHWMTEMLQEFGHMPAAPAWAILGLQAVAQGLAMALGVALWRWLVQRGAPSALAAWLALWAGEAVVPMIFPWFLGNAISPELEMIQIAELGGVHLVSAVLYASNAALGDLLLGLLDRRRPAFGFLLATLAAVGLTWGFGTVRLPQVDAAQATAPKIRIGMVEGNVGIWEKEAKYLDGPTRARTLRHNLLKHQQMSAQLERRGAELVIWPESAYQPYGASPVLHTADHFLLVGDGGSVWRHDGQRLAAERPDRLGLPRDLGLLTGLGSPRGDLWRALDRGRRVVTVTPKGATTVELPAGETGVATVAPPVDLFGRLEPGLVVGRSGRVWQLGWAGYVHEPTPEGGAQVVADAKVALREIPRKLAAPVDVTAAARSGAGRTVLVGRKGALLAVRAWGVTSVESPTTADLWTVAADPQGSLVVAAGAGGTVVQGDGDRYVAAQLGSEDLYAAWFASDGTAWLAGAKGALYERPPEGKWQKRQGPAAIDLLAGAIDADGNLLVVGRGGRLFLRGARGGFHELNAGARGEITAVLGFQAQGSYLVPRSARRVVPSRTPLPDPALRFPLNVQADQAAGELDRSSPIRGFATPLLFGAMTHGGPLPLRNAGCTDCYNSALLLDRQGRVQALHDKAFLLMFGEYIPFGEEFPQLYDLSPETSRFQPGTRTAPIELDRGPDKAKARMGMLICYEDLVPRYARRVAAHDPNVFVNLTNDAWFGQTAEPYHHLNLALIRTVEYRKWLLRSTNTGVSVFIDAAGRRVAETSLQGEETLLRDVPLLEGRTVYASLGDWPLAVLAVLLLVVTSRTFRSGSGGGAPKAKAAPKKPKKAKAKAAETLEPARF